LRVPELDIGIDT